MSTTPVIPFSFDLARAKFREQNERLNVEKLTQAIYIATENLAAYLKEEGGQITDLMKQHDDAFYFATFEQKGWGTVFMLDANGLQCVATPPKSNTDNNPTFTETNAFNTVMAAVNQGGFKAEEILPALKLKIALLKKRK